MRKSLCAASILALSVAVAPACATKKFVRGQVGEVNTKVDTLSGSLEETQERTRKNEERIGQVDQKGVFIEIEGHTDNVGASEVNERIGLERAESVKRYIYESHQVPLHKINVISYGEEKPVSPNKTRDGRAQNRRVVIRVLS